MMPTSARLPSPRDLPAQASRRLLLDPCRLPSRGPELPSRRAIRTRSRSIQRGSLPPPPTDQNDLNTCVRFPAPKPQRERMTFLLSQSTNTQFPTSLVDGKPPHELP